MNKRSKLIVCGIAVIAVLCMALPVLFHGTSNECKITGVSAADSRNHSVDTYTVEQDKKKCSVSFSDTAVIDTAFTLISFPLFLKIIYHFCSINDII